MASTYTNDLRLELIATGEAAATWGDKTNANLTNIAAAFGYATQDGFAANADSTTTVADGAADPARAMYFKVTSSATLTATRTLTIAPNTISRVMWIENATTGGQSIQISQGTGANVTIPTGKTAVVYLDGAGTGAAVVDAMAGVSSGASDTLAEILAAGNATGGTDIAVSTGDDITFADSSKAIFGAGSDLQIYHDGSHSYISDQGTGDLRILAADFRIRNAADNETMIQANSDADVSLWYNNSKKLATTNTGIDVTGVVTADAIEIDDTDDIRLRFLNASAFKGGIQVVTTAGDMIATSAVDDLAIRSQSDILFSTGGNIERMKIVDTGIDVTGTVTADGLTASGSGAVGSFDRTDANAIIELKRSGSLQGYIGASTSGDIILYNASAAQKFRAADNGDISFYEDTGTTAKFFWDASAESLGIGTSSPRSVLDLDGGSETQLRLQTTNTGSTTGDGLLVSLDASTNAQAYVWNYENAAMIFGTNATEAMRIDSSGNLLVGKTSTSGGIAGTVLAASGLTRLTASGIAVAEINRLSSDGSIVDFKKDGTTVGSIGSIAGGYLSISGTTGGRLQINGTDEYAWDTTQFYPTNDNANDLGFITKRWDDIYATNGTIQTSDRNEKQDIEALSDAEQRVAVVAKGLLRKFRWKSSVAEKGDDARTHFGIIAQDLQAAFEAEGLDAGDYAMFINTTWTDEETGEERSRMGVRYSELLAFIIAAL